MAFKRFGSVFGRMDATIYQIYHVRTFVAYQIIWKFCLRLSPCLQESVFVVGLVCCDGEGHLNDKSIMLEGRFVGCKYFMIAFKLKI